MGIKTRPPMLLVAVAVLAAEALALFVYTVITVIATATNDAYTVSNGVAQIIMQLILLAGLAWLASSVLKMRPWTRTPSVMVQLLIGFVAVALLQAHRWDWGVPLLLLAVAGLIGFLHPASLKALARQIPPRDQPQQQQKTQQPKNQQQKAQRTSKTGTSGKSGNTTKKSATPSTKSGNPAKRNPAGKPVSRRS